MSLVAVYVLQHCHDYEGSDILGVYDSAERAVDALREAIEGMIEPRWGDKHAWYQIDRQPLNRPAASSWDNGSSIVAHTMLGHLVEGYDLELPSILDGVPTETAKPFEPMPMLPKECFITGCEEPRYRNYFACEQHVHKGMSKS
ncbi:hypothetical protein SEA_SKOG_58 [Gordonia phage Skog]|uniref:DUF7336 domain-containing protein n=1 Tax=Gordonia phage Skog TaxID=2704033 RepID=A0A6G6XKB9_9CAUD|nr:hypothetical protein KHQ85_gp058 [Gordonia phage Skog]QIG58210.1 hypothetical protein SEA_SKOG_58 [Gordonia phage Skog]